MITRLMGSEVDVVRHGVTGRDRLNNPVTGELSRSRHRARLEQVGSTENETYVADQWRGFFPPGTDVRAGDTVEEGGRSFAVQGTPAREIVPGIPGADHVAVVLRFTGEVDPS